VLVVDQTAGDAAIEGGLASAATFRAMLAAAIAENPGAEIIVKTHPEVASGRKRGYLSDAQGPGVRLLAEAVNPWPLIEAVDRVYTVSSQLGLEALLAGRQVTCFGAGFYAGWGLTDDRVSIARRTARPTLEQLFSAIYFDYARYACPRTAEPLTFEEAVDRLAAARDAAIGRRIGTDRRPALAPAVLPGRVGGVTNDDLALTPA
jgi:capsular polysaccharide export protein